MQKWYLTIVLGIIGVFFLTVTYIALYLSKKNEKNISGAPFLGGVIIAVAFLLSPIKWLALLGLLDYGQGWSIKACSNSLTNINSS